MSSQLRYSYNPATQQYTLLPSQIGAAPVATSNVAPAQSSGLGSLYDAGGGGDAAPASEGSYSMSPETAVGMQNFGLAMQGIPSIGAQVVGSVVGAVPSSYGYATPTPVDNPVAPVETAIAPTEALASMNAQVAAEDEANQSATAVASTAGAVADAVAGVSAPDSATASAPSSAAAPAGVSDTGGSAMGDSGAGVGDVGGGGGGDSGGFGGGGDGGGSSATGGSDSSSTGSGASDTGAADSGWRRGGYVMNYEQGGVASLANKVQEKGRGDDKMLVHMTPKEVAGLQYLAMRHGGSLTVNPETGLVEAGFLKNILPMVAGAALAATGVGAPMAALLVGGGYGLATGSLEKGLMAGLGAFGGAGLGSALSAAGAGTGAGLSAPAMTGTQAGLSAQGAAGAAAAPSYALTSGTSSAAGMGLGGGLKTAVAPVSQVAGAITPAAAPVTFGNMGAGIKALGTEAGRSQFLTAAGGPMGLATKAGAAAAPMFASSLEEPTGAGGKVYQPYIRPFKFDAGPSSQDPNFRFRTGERGESTAEQRYLSNQFTPVGVFKPGEEPAYGTYKAGGIASLREGDFILPADVISHMGNGSSDAGMEIAISEFRARPIKGDGDGMSDSIPTDIEGKQKALVAHEEAQIPREMVAFLGGGSVEKGSKELEKFMTRVRKARTGKSRQAPEINVSKYLPA